MGYKKFEYQQKNIEMVADSEVTLRKLITYGTSKPASPLETSWVNGPT